MSKNIDDLLKEKLEGYKSKAPASAWSKIESGINKSDMPGWRMYLSIAAGLITILVVSYIVLNQNESDKNIDFTAGVKDSTIQLDVPATSKQLLSEVDQKEPADPGKDNQPENLSKTIANEELNGGLESENPPAVKNNEPEPKKPKETRDTETDKEIKTVDEPKEVTLEKTFEEPVELNTNDVVALNVPEGEQKMDTSEIVREVSPIEDFSIDKAIADNREEDLDPDNSTRDRGLSFKKILEIAKDLKTDNNAWSSLREAKNEFLTFGRNKNDQSE